jgi:hypothetical protein
MEAPARSALAKDDHREPAPVPGGQEWSPVKMSNCKGGRPARLGRREVVQERGGW